MVARFLCLAGLTAALFLSVIEEEAQARPRRLRVFRPAPLEVRGTPTPTRPIVTVLPSENPFKDILIQVQEDTTGSLLFGAGVNSDAGLVGGSIVLNERNFDRRRSSADTGLKQVTYAVADLVVPAPTHSPEAFRPLPERMSGEKVQPRGMIPWAKVTTGDARGTLEEGLIALIQNSVARDSWKDMGGQGTIQYYPLGMSLVVSAAPEVHEEIHSLLEALRRLQDVEVAVEMRVVQVAPEHLAKIFGELPRKEDPALVTEPTKERGVRLVRPRGETWSAQLDEVQMAMFCEALQGDRHSQIMQAPKVTMLNGQRVMIQVTDEQAFVTGVEINNDGTSIPKRQVFAHGMRMMVEPVVSADRRSVRLDVQASLAEMARLTPLMPVEVPIKSTDGEVQTFRTFLQQPSCTRLHVKPKLTVPDHGTAVLNCGVLPFEVRRETCHPLLAGVPFLGEMFTQVSYGHEDRNVLILLTPRIIVNEEVEVRD